MDRQPHVGVLSNVSEKWKEKRSRKNRTFLKSSRDLLERFAEAVKPQEGGRGNKRDGETGFFNGKSQIPRQRTVTARPQNI